VTREREFSVIAQRSYGVDPDRFDVVIRDGNHGMVIQCEAEQEAAEEIAAWLGPKLEPLFRDKAVRQEQRIRQMDKERRARDEKERPERERRERERAKRIKTAPRVTAHRCPDCGHVDDPEEFLETGYECSACGSTGRGPDGRRCDQCHRFRARVADCSCPSCEAPLEEVEVVSEAVELDGEIVEVRA
jgi:hypothetical protein